MWFPEFGIGVGTLVLAANVVLLGGYALGCHSLRHLAGGCFDQLSTRPCTSAPTPAELPEPAPHGVRLVEPLQRAFADLYIRLCSMGVWHDWRIV